MNTKPGKRLLKYCSNFKKNGILQRLMYYCNDEWNDFPQDVVIYIIEDVPKKPVVEVLVNGNKILLDFLHMMQFDMTTGVHQPIAWIDVSGKCFFPEIDCDDDERHNDHLHLEIKIHGPDLNEGCRESNVVARQVQADLGVEGGPTSPWISFPMLLAAISGQIPAQDMTTLNDNYELFRNNRISREAFVQMLRLFVGDALLASEIRNIQGP